MLKLKWALLFYHLLSVWVPCGNSGNLPDAISTGLSNNVNSQEYPNMFYVSSFWRHFGISKTLTSDLTIEFVPNRFIPGLCHVGVRRGESFHRCDYPGILASKAKDTRSQRPGRKLNYL